MAKATIQAPSRPAVDPATTTIHAEDLPRRSGRPRSNTRSIAKAVYFRDSDAIQKLEAILINHPRSSLSAVLQQMVGEFIKGYEQSPPDDNKLTITTTIYL